MRMSRSGKSSVISKPTTEPDAFAVFESRDEVHKLDET